MPHSVAPEVVAPVVVALVVAAGRGSRFGHGTPKQYRLLAGEPVLRRAVRPFLAHPQVGAVQVVVHPADMEEYGQAVAGLPLLDPVLGGATRQDSVLRGLESLALTPPDLVLIHDAARAFVTAGILDRVIEAITSGKCDGAIPALPVVDTLKRVSTDEGTQGTVISETVDRAGLWRAQTPQAFRFAPILNAHRRASRVALTDDAAVAEQAGLRVAVIPGEEENLKLTTEDDLRRGEQFLASRAETRTGSGFDVHRLCPGEHVMLCGVRVPHDHGLLGHSDADVGLHALTDAVLGAIGAGDIGSHFPPTEKRWRGAPSEVFLHHAADLVRSKRGRIVNVDITLICERPKVGPHRQAMRDKIAELLAISADRVSIKATTTEELGFTGRREGIAAQAVANVRLPRD